MDNSVSEVSPGDKGDTIVTLCYYTTFTAIISSPWFSCWRVNDSAVGITVSVLDVAVVLNGRKNATGLSYCD